MKADNELVLAGDDRLTSALSKLILINFGTAPSEAAVGATMWDALGTSRSRSWGGATEDSDRRTQRAVVGIKTRAAVAVKRCSAPEFNVIASGYLEPALKTKIHQPGVEHFPETLHARSSGGEYPKSKSKWHEV